MHRLINDEKKNAKEKGVNQWQNGYPNEEIIREYVKMGRSFYLNII